MGEIFQEHNISSIHFTNNHLSTLLFIYLFIETH